MATHWTDAWPEIAGRIAAPPRLLLACDFDGTLAPFAGDPDKVVLPAPALDVLRRLRSSPGVSLAIISGRSLADIVRRIPLDDVIFAGNHGLEIRGLGLDGERTQAMALKPRLHTVARELESTLGGVPGLFIENKGLSVTVHLRNVRDGDRDHVLRGALRAGERDPAFRVQQGHMVVELLPDIGWHKGAALKQIVARMGLPGSATFYAGDDTTDESVFMNFPTAITVSVGAEWVSAARWMARDPDDICRMLEHIAAARRR